MIKNNSEYSSLLSDVSILTHTIESIVHDCCSSSKTLDVISLSLARAHLSIAKEQLFKSLEKIE